MQPAAVCAIHVLPCCSQLVTFFHGSEQHVNKLTTFSLAGCDTTCAKYTLTTVATLKHKCQFPKCIYTIQSPALHPPTHAELQHVLNCQRLSETAATVLVVHVTSSDVCRVATPGVPFSEVQIDQGHYYASKDFYDPVKQRRINWGWATVAGGAQSLARTVTYHPILKQLVFSPVTELEKLRDSTPIGSVHAVVLQPQVAHSLGRSQTCSSWFTIWC
jgi:hypothetical protein